MIAKLSQFIEVLCCLSIKFLSLLYNKFFVLQYKNAKFVKNPQKVFMYSMITAVPYYNYLFRKKTKKQEHPLRAVPACMEEGMGFEPTVRVNVHSISNAAPSTARPPLHIQLFRRYCQNTLSSIPHDF